MSENTIPPFLEEKILIVDDNQQTAEYIRCLLEEDGFDSVVALTGKEALEIVKELKVDLVILDVIMPDMNGIDVAAEIKASSASLFLPVIMVSALGAAEDKVAGLKFADDYITKPFSGDELIARVRTLLRTRRLHIQLSQSKLRYECLYENIPHFYLSIDPERKINECNRSFREVYQICKPEIIGKEITSFFAEEDRSILAGFLDDLEKTKKSSSHDRIFTMSVPQSDHPVFVKLNAVYMGEETSGWAIVIAMEDVTKQVQLQEEQKIARKQLYRSARLASIGTLASGVAHEMNNPLTAILGFSSALLDRVDHHESIDDAELDQYLRIINVEALRCRDIVENLSRFAREADVTQKHFSLNNCINDAIQLVRSKASRANITISNELKEVIEIYADQNKLEQVFVNLLSNAIEFCQSGAMVKIVPVTPVDTSKGFTIKIVDNGPGIKPDILPKVFDPFFTTKTVGTGTGMGLAICHKIMEETSGSIDIISEEGNGTSVVLHFPAQKKTAEDTGEE
ncbi:MAG TPA: ATP-binding protein [Chitinispirillaceae bacterium]|nr:ATP-binding protein [Chitinispirillaceae bacterium]